MRKLNKNASDANADRLSNYLQTKVGKMQREYLELLFLMIFEGISNKDDIINMIARGQTEPNIQKKIYKTVIQPKFNIYPFHIKSIENILNRVYKIDQKNGKDDEGKKSIATQTINNREIAKMQVAIFKNSSLDKIKKNCKLPPNNF